MLSSYIIVICLQMAFAFSQAPLQVKDSWSVQIDSQWDVLGPFPVHAREQHYLSPGFPLNLSESIDYARLWPSSYADNGVVGWSKATLRDDNTLRVSFPEIRWDSLRATEGWAALQHHATLRGTLTIFPPELRNKEASPLLYVSLKQGSYFCLRLQSQDASTFVSEWYPGNIYDLENALPVPVVLPSNLSASQPTNFDLFVSGDYEIRLFGDPRVQQSETPTLLLGIEASVKEPQGISAVVLQPSLDVKCDFISGYAFGDSIGIGVQSLSGWWSVKDLILPPNVKGIRLQLLSETVIAPTQTRTVSILIKQTQPFPEDRLSFEIILEANESCTSLSVSVPIVQHTSLVGQQPKHVIQATYLSEGATPLPFLAIVPSEPSELKAEPPILALHGAGVDVIGQQREMWVDALPTVKRSWVVIPTGRTSWGLDWHGPSARDAWASFDALKTILDGFNGEEVPESLKMQPNGKAILMGHSNGGQGTWYLSSRYPDRVLAAIPAAAYLKSQAYVPLAMSRSGHFIDPTLRSILESSLTPDDNDLHFSNLVDVKLLAIHGGADENVPVWHTREAVSSLLTWYPAKPVIFKEDAGEGHWYADVLNNPAVDSFLSQLDIVAGNDTTSQSSFTMTVANPQECGSVRGWKIEKVKIPGRLARITVRVPKHNHLEAETTNVNTLRIIGSTEPRQIEVDGQIFYMRGDREDLILVDTELRDWKILRSDKTHAPPPGRIQAILSSPGLLSIVISDSKEPGELSAALRIAHALQLYHRLDSEIITESLALNRSRADTWSSGGVMWLGGPSSIFIQEVTESGRTPIRVSDGGFSIGSRRFAQPGQALIASHPHPSNHEGLMLLLLYNDSAGLERALRLFPFRTGVAVPDWVVVGDGTDKFGAAGLVAAGVWANDWQLSVPMTWFHQ